MKRNHAKLFLGGVSVALLLCFIGSVPARTVADPKAAISSFWWWNPPTLFIAVGNSLTQGARDATNNYINTQNAYLQLVYEKLKELESLKFSQPFLDEDGRRISPYKTPTNLGVDGADIFSVDGYRYWKRAGAAENELTNDYRCERFLPFFLKDNWDKVLFPINLWAGKPVSQMDALIWHLNRRWRGPAWIIFWVGANDAATASLGSGGRNPEFLPIPFEQIQFELKPLLSWLLRFGEDKGVLSFKPYTESNIQRNLTTVANFESQFNHLMDRLKANLRPTDKVFLLTLPYYTEIGYLMDADDLEFYLQKLDTGYTVPGSFGANDRVSLLTFGFMYALLKEYGKLAHYTLNEILEIDGLVLSDGECGYIKERIDSFNDVIQTAATHYNFQLIDIGSYLNDIFEIETKVDEVEITRRWGRGNGFSLDGVHGSYTAHALIANYVLENLEAPLYNDYELHNILEKDPYIDWDGDGWVRGPEYKASGRTKLLFLFKDADGDTGSDTEEKAMIDIKDSKELWDLISDILLEQILSSLLF